MIRIGPIREIEDALMVESCLLVFDDGRGPIESHDVRGRIEVDQFSWEATAEIRASVRICLPPDEFRAMAELDPATPLAYFVTADCVATNTRFGGATTIHSDAAHEVVIAIPPGSVGGDLRITAGAVTAGPDPSGCGEGTRVSESTIGTVVLDPDARRELFPVVAYDFTGRHPPGAAWLIDISGDPEDHVRSGMSVLVNLAHPLGRLVEDDSTRRTGELPGSSGAQTMLLLDICRQVFEWAVREDVDLNPRIVGDLSMLSLADRIAAMFTPYRSAADACVARRHDPGRFDAHLQAGVGGW